MNILNNPDWTVTDVVESTNIEVTATYTPQPTACLLCGTVGTFYKHGTQKQKVKDLPTLGRPTVITLARQRYRCRSCGQTFSQPVEGMNTAGTMTNRLVRYIQEEAVIRPFTHVANATGVTEGTVRRLFGEYIERLDERVRFVTPQVLGIDELHLLGDYRCVLTNVKERTLVDLMPSRTQVVVFQRLMRLEDRHKVEVVTMDMWNPYREAARQALPQAVVVVDKFHIVRMANKAVEALRKGIRATLPPKARRGLMHDRFVFLKRRGTLTEKDMLKLESWTGQHPDLKALYDSKESFYDIWEAASEAEARDLYAKWLANLPDSQKAAWKDVTTAMRNWENEIFAYFTHRYTNAYTEAFNGLTKIANRLGRGYSFDAIRAKMLYSRGEFKKPGEPSYMRTEDGMRELRATPVEILANGSLGMPISTVIMMADHEMPSTGIYE